MNLFEGTSTASALSGTELIELTDVDGLCGNIDSTAAKPSVYSCSGDKFPSVDNGW